MNFFMIRSLVLSLVLVLSTPAFASNWITRGNFSLFDSGADLAREITFTNVSKDRKIQKFFLLGYKDSSIGVMILFEHLPLENSPSAIEFQSQEFIPMTSSMFFICPVLDLLCLALKKISLESSSA